MAGAYDGGSSWGDIELLHSGEDIWGTYEYSSGKDIVQGSLEYDTARRTGRYQEFVGQREHSRGTVQEMAARQESILGVVAIEVLDVRWTPSSGEAKSATWYRTSARSPSPGRLEAEDPPQTDIGAKWLERQRDSILKLMKDKTFQGRLNQDIVDRFKDVKGKVGKVGTLVDMTRILTTDTAGKRPEETLRLFGQWFRLVQKVVPADRLPVVGEIMTIYADLIDAIADALTQISRRIRGMDEVWGPVHPEAWEGGGALLEYMRQLMRNESLPAVPEEVIAWVKEQRDQLTRATGEAPPAERRTGLLGIDPLSEDVLDPEGLRQWFRRHRHTITVVVYGRDALRKSWWNERYS